MYDNDVGTIQEQYQIIGRTKELGRAIAAVKAGKHIFFEGAVGVGKTIVASALAHYFSRNFYRVDGDERYTEYKLVGWFDPVLVMTKAYSWDTFMLGPLTKAMMEGAFLFINELNRMPEGTQNVLLPAMDEGQIFIPKIGVVKAKSGFLIIATQNPEEFVGTSRLGEALKDRFVWIHLDYQSETEEQKIVEKETGCKDRHLTAMAVNIIRRTREDDDIRRGASIRGAIDMISLLNCLSSTPDLDVWVEAAVMALATKIELQDKVNQKLEDVVRRIVTSVINEGTNKKKQAIKLQLSLKKNSRL